jgi:hypothetical protein
MARGMGEHLECNPCGNLASRALCVTFGRSGGVAVALAVKMWIIPNDQCCGAPAGTFNSSFLGRKVGRFELTTTRLQAAVAL